MDQDSVPKSDKMRDTVTHQTVLKQPKQQCR